MRLHRWMLILVPFCAVWLASCVEHAWEVRTYSLGQKVAIGHLTYLGIVTQWLPAFGQGPGARAAQNQFLLVRLSVSNSGNSDVAVPNFSVEDSAGHRFPELSDGTGVPDWIGALRTLASNDTLVGNAAFDVAVGPYTLHILDEDGQHEARIELPLDFQNQSVEAPALELSPAPSQATKK
ncbi:MAG: hypothetical protein ABSE42_06830 [Bryobacteraceae bacterium]